MKRNVKEKANIFGDKQENNCNDAVKESKAIHDR